MAARTQQKVKRRRKHGRKKERSASHQRYNEQKRWLTNKARRIRKNNSEAEYLAYCKTNNLKVSSG